MQYLQMDTVVLDDIGEYEEDPYNAMGLSYGVYDMQWVWLVVLGDELYQTDASLNMWPLTTYVVELDY